MRVAVAMALLLASALGGGPGHAAARPAGVEVATADGAVLGRLHGERVGAHTRFRLDDVARLLAGTVRRSADGTRATVVGRWGILEVTRDQNEVRVDGRSVTLAAPTLVDRAGWTVSGDLLVRALPVLLGTGVRIRGTGAGPDLSPPMTTARAPALRQETALAALPPSETPVARLPEPEVERRPPVDAPTSRGGGGDRGPDPLASRVVAGASRPAGGPVELRYRSYPAYTRVVLEGAAPLEPRLVESGGAVVVALGGVRRITGRTVRTVRDGLVDTLELTTLRGGPVLRVTFERAPARRKVSRLDDPPRLVLDFQREGATVASTEAVGSGGLRTIVIDPGHGGHDAGAVGPGGLHEKDLTLDLARRLASIVEDELGVRAVLTRSRDAFIPLRERTALANREKADLFVSVHVNAAPAATASGTETYFLSTEATDNAARAAAAFENKVIDLEPGPPGRRRDVLRSILWDLAQSDFQQESSRLAETLQGQLDRALRLPGRGVKQAPFYVLGGAAMPAVLVEIGFISNRQEEQRLGDEGYRDRIARALAAGLGAYKRSYEQRARVVARP